MTATEVTPEGRYKQQFKSRALTIAAWAFGAEILVNVFRWQLVNVLTVFLEPFFEMGLWAVLLASFVWSTVHLIRTRKRCAQAMLSPLALNVFTLLIIQFVPFTMLTTEMNFRLHYDARMAVVKAVIAGKLDDRIRQTGGREDVIALPAGLSHLSTGGDILRWRRPNAELIFFFDFRGILSSFAGFVYSTDGTPPEQEDFGGDFVEIDPLRDNWFYASSGN